MRLIAFFLLLLSASANAGSVVFGTTGGRALQRADGSALPAGCTLFIGSFNLPASSRDATLAATRDYATLKSWFTPLADGTAGSGTTAQPGVLGAGLLTNDYPVAGASFAMITQISASTLPPGTPLYLWVFDAATPEAARQWGIYAADSWTGPPAFGVSALNTGADSGVRSIQGSISTAAFRLASIPASFSNWSWQSFGLNAAASQAGGSADPDNDGIPNLGEYAWGLSAQSKDLPPSPQWDSSSGMMVLRYLHPRLLPDVSVTAEISSDLTTWIQATGTVTTTTAGYDTLTVPAGNGTRCFWRVRFNLVAP